MKKFLAAAGISAMLMVSQTAAFADGATIEDAPRVVDRLSAVVASPDEVVAPVKPGTPAPVLATGAYNSLISQATTAEAEAYGQALESYFRCGPYGCNTYGGNGGWWMLGGLTLVGLVALSDDSESD